MVNNCLVTKLNSVVDNNNLSKLGILELNVNSSGSGTTFVITPTTGKTLALDVIGNGGIATTADGLQNNPKTHLEISSASTIHCKKDEDYTISIKQKYDISDYNQIDSNNNFISIVHGLNVFNYCIDLISLNVNVNTYGDISIFKNCTKLSKLNISLNNNITGDISSIAHLPLKNIIFDKSPLIYGSIESFVERAIANNIIRDTSNTMYGYFANNGITWGGSNLGGYFSGHFIWSKENDVTKIACFYNTSSSGSPSDATTVYCSGYGTQEQAEASFPGKTVIRRDV